ncbi:MAG: Fur family transcriptional regulator [Nostocoides sp.]
MDEHGELLRRHGLRVTRQRERILAVVAALGHATAEEASARVAIDGGPALPPSTIYRALEAMEQAGALRHTHLDHRSPSYQLADHDAHIHLVCNRCGSVSEVPASIADDLVGRIREQRGFDAAFTHMAVQGRCAVCRM